MSFDMHAGTWHRMGNGGLRVSLSIGLADEETVVDALRTIGWKMKPSIFGVSIEIPAAVCAANNLTEWRCDPNAYLRDLVDANLIQPKLPFLAA